MNTDQTTRPDQGLGQGFCTGQFKRKGILAVCGGALVHLSMGSLLSFGNMSPYITSYMREVGSASDLTFTQSAWVYAIAIIFQGGMMSVGGLLETKIGPRLTTLGGSLTMSLGVLLTYQTIQMSFPLTVVTSGVVVGTGIGLTYTAPVRCGMEWFPERKGLVSGLVVAGFGSGSFFFNQIQTAYINPDNLVPDSGTGPEKYFDQQDLLDRVPKMFLIQGGICAAMQLVGSLLLASPPCSQTNVSVLWSKKDEEKVRQPSSKQGPSSGVKADENTGCLVPSGDDAKISLPPSKALRDKHFYMLWSMFFCMGMGALFFTPLYKAYGLTFIKDDRFLALAGSFAAVFNGLGRIFWGIIADKFSCQTALLLETSSFTCLMLTLSCTEYGGKPLFFIYVCLLFGTFNGSYSIFPTTTSKCFGPRYLGMNYGILFTSQMVSSALTVFFSESLKLYIGWHGLFFLISAFCAVSFITALLFNAKDSYGNGV